jgi:hypothetical protein
MLPIRGAARRPSVDDLYVDSTIVFGTGQTYSFKLDITPKPLTGTCTVRDWGADGGVLETDYGEGRTNELHLVLHPDASGGVVGFVVREGAEQINARYYAR